METTKDPKKLVTDKIILQLASYHKDISNDLTNYMQTQDQLETNAKFLSSTVEKFQVESVRILAGKRLMV